ncbi:MFS transporter [Clostridium saccharobutylicum]|uniref:MFS-type transporter YfkL n=1 Tax=Clostridium saccharobutylicum DSM 13864 TaxID=1345695 RepID=U5MWX1_CLOSA|nr:MFS transporter [Clostridium saccharobutylicum]AGX45028.1 MFS-type transporter YfkL [Clostridium saccharobutylicum DSM 13864]AQR92310.1 inner membrane transport protein YdiM [Clostridium saccharobutylicum]AQS02212.1 inner membrane transport protein YdiM [Clostridium saccharobutylicum]AQS16195.1 inner membrane transport protein YdiM [Clostridium saccharobutylicum]MBA2903814.1 MFS family permease [Clostridium saccharobutylicum]
MFKNDYFKTALGIYISYCMLGMIVILLSSNMAFVTKQFNTDAAGISFLISVEGIVRSATLYITGRLSDKFGRKKILCLAPIFAIVFLVGIPLAPNYGVAVLLSAFAGISHAFMDASSYPSLIECFPKTPGTATVIIKAFIAIGGIILPIMISFFATRNMFYGYTFFVIAAVMFFNGLFLFKSRFPKANQIENSNDAKVIKRKFASEPVLKKEGLALIIIGFTSNSIFTGFQTWMPTYGQNVLGMNQINSLKLITYYSVGALISVLILAKLLQKTIKPIVVLVVYPIIGIMCLILILIVRTELVTTVGFFLIGLSSAGVLQMAQTTMGEIFWKNKGATIALVSTASGISAAVIPALTGMILRHSDILHVFYLMIAIFIIGILSAIFAKLRYDKIMIND